MKTLTRILSLSLLFTLVIALSSAFTPNSPALEGVVGEDGRGNCYLLNEEDVSEAGSLENIFGPRDNQGSGMIRCTGVVHNASGGFIFMSNRTHPEVTCISVSLGETDRWRQTVRPDGTATLICNFGSNF